MASPSHKLISLEDYDHGRGPTSANPKLLELKDFKLGRAASPRTNELRIKTTTFNLPDDKKSVDTKTRDSAVKVNADSQDIVSLDSDERHQRKISTYKNTEGDCDEHSSFIVAKQANARLDTNEHPAKVH